MQTDDLNEGAVKLRASGKSAAEIAAFLARRGVNVTRQTASNWRAGKTLPPDEARAAFAGAPFRIPTVAWERPAKAPDGVMTGGSPSKPPGRPGGPTAGHGGPGDRRSAAELAAGLLARIEGFRARAEAEGTPAAAARLCALEGRAIERLAKLTGEGASPEGELVRSPQWARLRAEILGAVGKHPAAARDLLAALEAHGHAPPKGTP